MRVRLFFLFFTIILFITGCSLDPYCNGKYGVLSIDSWFSDKELGEVRMKNANISEIVSSSCEFYESKGNKYVFDCKVTYKEIGETVIPLSKNSSMNVIAVFIKESGDKYDCKVYSDIYKLKSRAWENDEYLNY